jgi:hypothetical protein
MARSEGKLWLGSRLQQRFFVKLVVSVFGARLPNLEGCRIIKIGNAALFIPRRRKSSLGVLDAPVHRECLRC